MGNIITNEEMITELSKGEIYDMWTKECSKSKKLQEDWYLLKKERDMYERESEKYRRFWKEAASWAMREDFESRTCEDGSMIEMTQEHCILCNGSGFINPYPYRKRKKCDHKWNRGSFMERLSTIHDEMQEKIEEYSKWQRALESEVKDEHDTYTDN